MKKYILILMLFSLPLFAQEKKEEKKDEIKLLENKANEIKTAIVQLQSELYQKEKQLKDLYTELNLYLTAIQVKKEAKKEEEK